MFKINSSLLGKISEIIGDKKPVVATGVNLAGRCATCSGYCGGACNVSCAGVCRDGCKGSGMRR